LERNQFFIKRNSSTRLTFPLLEDPFEIGVKTFPPIKELGRLLFGKLGFISGGPHKVSPSSKIVKS